MKFMKKIAAMAAATAVAAVSLVSMGSMGASATDEPPYTASVSYTHLTLPTNREV